jgi:hypothetical protein
MIGLASGPGCTTQFVGSAHITPEACAAKCTESRLQMAGMVYMGEYSSACVCETIKPPDAAAPGAPAPSAAIEAAPGAIGASAGVVMQMRREQQRRLQERDQQRQQPPPPAPPPQSSGHPR